MQRARTSLRRSRQSRQRPNCNLCFEDVDNFLTDLNIFPDELNVKYIYKLQKNIRINHWVNIISIYY